MGRWYYLGPWLDPVPGDPTRNAYRPPDGTVGLIDLRPMSPGSTYGFFSTDAPLSDSNYEAFGDANGTKLDGLTMSVAQRNKWASMLGIASTPQAGTLLDLLWDTLTVYADPDGLTHAKPIMPTVNGRLELHLGGHSLVRSARIPSDVTATPHWPQMQRVIQSDYRVVAAQSEKGKTPKERSHHARWLGFLRDKYRLTDDQASGLLIPSDLPKVKPQKPETTLSDDFNRANGDLGASWAETPGTGWTVLSNQADLDGSGTTYEYARYESDLSGSDHYAQVKVAAADDPGWGGACVRFNSANQECYLGHFGFNARTEAYLFSVNSSGTRTQIGSTVTGLSYSWPQTIKTQANGSTITFYIGTDTIYTETNSAISGNTRGGMNGRGSPDENVALDDWTASDLAAGGTTRGAPFGSRGTAFNGGRTFMGILR